MQIHFSLLPCTNSLQFQRETMDNPLLNRSKAPKKKNNKKSKSSSPAVKSTPPALSPGETDHSTPENDEEEAEVDLFDLLNQQLEISAESEPVAAAASSAPSNGISQLAGGDKKPSRQQSRKVRLFSNSLQLVPADALNDQNKAADALQAIKVQAEQEVELENDQSIAIERSAIKASCASLGVEVKEIRPDGHWYVEFVAVWTRFATHLFSVAVSITPSPISRIY